MKRKILKESQKTNIRCYLKVLNNLNKGNKEGKKKIKKKIKKKNEKEKENCYNKLVMKECLI